MKDFRLFYPFSYRRRPTRSVPVGDVFLGSAFPIAIQSMLTSHTYLVEDCMREIRELDQAGCALIRITIQSKRDLEAMPRIRECMQQEGITRPLIADIHFAPHLAVDACQFFEKIRINPGNISDRPKNYSPAQKKLFPLEEGKLRLKERLEPIAKAILAYDRALRIGVNNGSLSERMIQAYGDSPLGMVESALEAAEIFQSLGVEKIVISLKSSNPFVVNRAYRLMAERNQGPDAFPLHLGVTEAGNELMGRTKSLAGIGPLLQDGIGDTIRVSLTEDSVKEVQFAKKLLAHHQRFVDRYKDQKNQGRVEGIYAPLLEVRPKNRSVVLYGKPQPSALKTSLKTANAMKPALILGQGEAVKVGWERNGSDQTPAHPLPFELDFLYSWEQPDEKNSSSQTEKAQASSAPAEIETGCVLPLNSPSFISLGTGPTAESFPLNLFRILQQSLPKAGFDQEVRSSKAEQDSFFVWPFQENASFELRRLQAKGELPAILLVLPQKSIAEDYSLEITLANLIGQGLVDGLLLPAKLSLVYQERLKAILQALRIKFSETDFVACPSCGRTMFDLQEVTKKVKASTLHLKGVKIGIMGCMVNGPGEMADADFGYVGAGEKRIDLYVGHARVKKDVPEERAVEELVALIKQHGRWVEKETAS